MSLIQISNLTFCYDGSYDPIFENVSFQIDTDWKLGFTGRNGRGKTTFLNLLMGKHEYAGTISSSVPFDYFPFDVPDKTQDTLDVVNSICPQAELWQLNRELSLLDVSQDVLHRPFETLSSGEQTKVLLAALFLNDHHFLLIDEPTNHLDMEARKIVGDYLNAKKGFILISHDRAFLDRCIDHVLSINKTNIEIQKGNFSSWLHNKEMQDRFETEENAKLKKQIGQLSAAAKRTAGWSDKVEKTKIGSLNSGLKPDKGYIGHKAAKMMKRAGAIEARREKAAQEKEKLLKNIETAETLSVKPLEYPKNRLVELENLSVLYGDKRVFDDLSFTVSRGDRIALCGKNGCGKSSILKLLTGEEINFTGRVQMGKNLIISYVPQDTSLLLGNLKDYAEESHIDESLFKAILRKLDFSRVQFEKDMADFSEGQKKKVLIAKSLCEQAHLYLWDEPLNFIDVLSRMQIEELLLKYRPTMLFVEHDSSFVDSIATRRILF
ncbi:Lsa family ABC-F type ribosomal protection protein [Caproiciproducens sp. CPB-2]|uniref:Lsa family ABC-F type ribosomal protection protein n=1 Tax=Caproiciproducens sp. CPB-2 TaxID=3030017 RepID=UPI0023DC52FB|nr:ABC-F type ribosomal protection protein [Caproiciproducens sp. CPB-2]MDF1493192.1 ABC-F type ribosomal protection protein [Caproiciproducens sp. CPB-2]